MRRLFLLLVLAAALLAAAAPAGASTRVQFGIQDDAWIGSGPGTLDQRLDRLQQLGVSLVRFNLQWSQIAARRPTAPRNPKDARYAWGLPDAVLNGLHARKIDVVLGLVGSPRWANGGRSSNWAPTRGADFADFAYAAARSYPWVRKWLVWNEPNQRIWLRPTSPAIYVTKLLNPAYAALHQANPGNLVGGGVTAPRASYGGVSPVTWIQAMGRLGARLDAYAHHPYPSRPRAETPTTGGCDHCTTITMADLPRLLATVQAAFGAKRIWLTEYGYQTNPPDPYLGVSPALQAQYVGDAVLRAYLAPRVDMLIQYLYQDEPTLGRFQSGLVYLNGTPKPALAAFQLPLSEVFRSGVQTTLFGQVRPGNGARSYRLQVRAGGAWKWAGGTRQTTRGGYLRMVVAAPKGAQVRVFSADAHGYSAVLTIR